MGGMERLLLTLAIMGSTLGCEREPDPPQMPPVPKVEAAYGDEVTVDVSGNLLRVTVPMPEGFERGGSLWARSGPYFYLFTTATRDLLVAYPDVAAVEVVAVTEDGEEVSRARLHRNALNAITWDHAIAYASQAQTEGSERPVYVQDLLRWAEERTESETNPEFIPE